MECPVHVTNVRHKTRELSVYRLNDDVRPAQALGLCFVPTLTGTLDPCIGLEYRPIDAVKEIAREVGAQIGKLPAEGHGMLVSLVGGC